MRIRHLFVLSLLLGGLLWTQPAHAANPHSAGFGGTFRFASFTSLNLFGSSSGGSVVPSGSLDFRTWTKNKVFSFSLHLGANAIVLGSNNVFGVAPGISLDFGLLRRGPFIPYLGLKLSVLVAGSGGGMGILVELQPRFGVEMFLFMKRKISLFVEIGVPISIPVGAPGALIEFGSLALGFRYYV